MGSSGDRVKDEGLEEVNVVWPGEFPISVAGEFSEGEQILALHGDQLYDAKILRVEERDGEWRYFVHYRGWNKSWDEWLGIDRVLKHTMENIEKKQAQHKNHDYDYDPGRKSEGIKRDGTTVIPINKRKWGSERKNPDTSVAILSDIEIPISLKKQLVRDWEYITQQEKLVKLPCCPTVDQILSKYLEDISKNSTMLADSTGEILKGLRCYFDRALPAMLLYEKERSQYLETVTDNISPSAVYGAQHLLRLFVKLPEVLAHVKIEKKTSKMLLEGFNDLIRFLKMNGTSFFTSSYNTCKVSQATRTSNSMNR